MAQELADGKTPKPTDAGKLHELATQAEAHQLAVAEAEARRRVVLQTISREACTAVAEMHRARVERLVELFNELNELWRTIGEIPTAIKSCGLTPDNSFPQHGREQWQRFASFQLSPSVQALQAWLSETEIDQ